ncbi:MAG: hypothetical protein AAGF11_12550 [Myxococcota bacterium]
MRWPRRGILIRLVIYVPIITVLAWRARGGCNTEATMEPEGDLEQKVAPHRRVITFPDGTQQSIVEVTPEQAEAIIGHPISSLDEAKGAKAEPAAAADRTAPDAAGRSKEAEQTKTGPAQARD